MNRRDARGGKGRRPWPRGAGGRPDRPRGAGSIGLRQLDGRDFELTHPRCVDERRDDYAEGLEIWRAGEPDEAREVLRYALEGCGDNLWIHATLGRIALEPPGDPALARGHFGYAVELVRRALPADFDGRLPADRPANRPFYDALDGLIACCEADRRAPEAAELRALGARLTGGPGRS
jgi:hypothetical protein